MTRAMIHAARMPTAKADVDRDASLRAAHGPWALAAGLGDVGGTVSLTTTLPESVTVELRWNGVLVASTGIDTVTGAYSFTGVPAGTFDVVATDGTTSVTGPATVTDATTTTVDLTLP